MRSMPDWRWTVRAVVLMAWTFVVLTLYYVVHKPFEPANALALLSTLRDLLIAALVMYASAGIGLHCLPGRQEAAPVNGYSTGSLERLVFAAGLGSGCMGLIVFGVSMAGWLYWPVMWALLGGGIVLGGRGLPHLIRHACREGLELPSGKLYRFVAVFVTGMLLIALSQALLPPTAWDSLVYHLTGPKLYIEAHRFLPDTDIVHMGFPALAEMLYMLGMSLAGPAVAQIIDWVFGALTLFLLYAFARRYLTSSPPVGSASSPSHFHTQIGWLAMALLLSAPTIVMLSFWAYIDVSLMFYELSAIYAFLRWREAGDRWWLIAVGAFCGFAIGTKYSAVSLTVALALLTAWDKRKEFSREGIGSVLWLGGTATLVMLPWLLKNGFFLGNPFYPFVFGGANWDHYRQMWVAQPGTGLAYTAPWKLLTAPWEMTIFGSEGKVGFSATLGPLYLIGLFVLPFVWRYIPNPHKRVLRPLLAVCGVQYLFWLVAIALSAPLIQARLLLPVFPLLAILAASAFVHIGALRRPQFAVDWVLHVVLALALGLNLLSAVLEVLALNPLAYAAGWESRTSYLERRLGPHSSVMDYINKELPAEAHVYFLWEPRSFYCNRPCRPDPVLDAFSHLVYRLGSATAIADYFREAGYTHVLLYKRGLDFLLAEENTLISEKETIVLNELQRTYFDVMHEEGEAYTLYRLNEITDGQ